MLYKIYRMIVIFFWRKKRRYRMAELHRHIEAIQDPRGCRDAMRLYKECCHISEHYLIPLSEVGFKNDDPADLFIAAGLSLKHCDNRELEVMTGFPVTSKQ